jgi:hypothetical protein
MYAMTLGHDLRRGGMYELRHYYRVMRLVAGFPKISFLALGDAGKVWRASFWLLAWGT